MMSETEPPRLTDSLRQPATSQCRLPVFDSLNRKQGLLPSGPREAEFSIYEPSACFANLEEAKTQAELVFSLQRRPKRCDVRHLCTQDPREVRNGDHWGNQPPVLHNS